MKKFNIPSFYSSSLITQIKSYRNLSDPKKKDYKPTPLNCGRINFLLARHLGFCYGVENAIEIAYKTIEENPGKRIFLLSEMIHNPGVNEDLISLGVRFIMDTSGNQLVNWKELEEKDVVIIPAFGTTLEIEKILNEKGINPYQYNTTCPFVEKVWNRSKSLGEEGYTVVIHGKQHHEETRATFSHSNESGKSIIIRDLSEAKILGSFILNEISTEKFYKYFKDKMSNGFDAERDLKKIGVVNQTTMLATETQEIANYLKNVMLKRYGVDKLKNHFADTRDTLCYATNDNQDATYGLLEEDADLAIVVGGYNSSNTGHIVELCEEKLPTYFVSSQDKIISPNEIKHFDVHSRKESITNSFIPDKIPVVISVTSGASCPDSVVEAVLRKILSFYDDVRDIEEVVSEVISP